MKSIDVIVHIEYDEAIEGDVAWAISAIVSSCSALVCAARFRRQECA
jgi:hypothetical protein